MPPLTKTIPSGGVGSGCVGALSFLQPKLIMMRVKKIDSITERVIELPLWYLNDFKRTT